MDQPKEPLREEQNKSMKILNWLLKAIGGLLFFFGLMYTVWVFDLRGLIAVIFGLALIKLGGGKLKDYIEFG